MFSNQKDKKIIVPTVQPGDIKPSGCIVSDEHRQWLGSLHPEDKNKISEKIKTAHTALSPFECKEELMGSLVLADGFVSSTEYNKANPHPQEDNVGLAAITTQQLQTAEAISQATQTSMVLLHSHWQTLSQEYEGNGGSTFTAIIAQKHSAVIANIGDSVPAIAVPFYSKTGELSHTEVHYLANSDHTENHLSKFANYSEDSQLFNSKLLIEYEDEKENPKQEVLCFEEVETLDQLKIILVNRRNLKFYSVPANQEPPYSAENKTPIDRLLSYFDNETRTHSLIPRSMRYKYYCLSLHNYSALADCRTFGDRNNWGDAYQPLSTYQINYADYLKNSADITAGEPLLFTMSDGPADLLNPETLAEIFKDVLTKSPKNAASAFAQAVIEQAEFYTLVFQNPTTRHCSGDNLSIAVMSPPKADNEMRVAFVADGHGGHSIDEQCGQAASTLLGNFPHHLARTLPGCTLGTTAIMRTNQACMPPPPTPKAPLGSSAMFADTTEGSLPPPLSEPPSSSEPPLQPQLTSSL